MFFLPKGIYGSIQGNINTIVSWLVDSLDSILELFDAEEKKTLNNNLLRLLLRVFFTALLAGIWSFFIETIWSCFYWSNYSSIYYLCYIYIYIYVCVCVCVCVCVYL